MHSTQGIVLNKTLVGEADAIFSIYTKDFGKIRALAQGVRKENAKLRGHLEPFNRVGINFVLGKNGQRLTGAWLIDFWPGIKNNLAGLVAASYMAEIVDSHCFESEKDENLWDTLVGFFSALNSNKERFEGPRDFSKFLSSFELKFLEALGYAGETDIRFLGEPMVVKPAYIS